MQRKSIVCCLILLLSLKVDFAKKTASAQTSENAKTLLARESTFHSTSLGRDMHYLVLLPHDYENGHRFPVLYLLHGLYGDYKNWDTLTHLENYAKTLPLLIVMPDADNSWYTNSATKPADKFEDYIAKDLISEIDAKYRTVRERRSRAIAGLSMGGYGAVKLSLKYPELFAFTGSLSGAFNAAQNLDDLRPDFRVKLLEVFGNAGSRTREQNDIFRLLKTTHDYQYFYLGCGTADFFLDTNRDFSTQLSAKKIPYEYHETPGDHTWEYWDSALAPMLQATVHTLESDSSLNPKARN
jgi:putative tributyrin esterase